MNENCVKGMRMFRDRTLVFIYSNFKKMGYFEIFKSNSSFVFVEKNGIRNNFRIISFILLPLI